MRKRYIDLNRVLMAANLFVACLHVYAYFQLPDNEYIDRETILLGMALAVQTHVALLFESRRRDPLVLLLVFDMIIFYGLRVYTLALYSYSVVFERYAYDAHNSNQALIFVIVANLFLYAGLYVVRLNDTPAISAEGWRPSAPWRVIAVLVATIIFGYIGGNFVGSVPRFFNFLVAFFAPSLTVMMGLAYYLLFRRSLSKRSAVAIAALIGLDMVAHTLWGSRSAVMFFVLNCMFVVFAIAGRIQLRRKYVYAGVLLLPAGIVILSGIFAISTVNRAAREGGRTLDIGKAVEAAAESGTGLFDSKSLDLLFAPVADRLGYFDYTAEIMAHRYEYGSLINVRSYLKSIVDNLLTPGFDVFDQPRISNGLRFIYQGIGPPSKSRVEDDYQSDQFGIYGEFYALFGYACLPLLFLIAYGLKRLYVSVSSPNPFMLTMKRIVVLSAFLRIMDSFGVDWVIIEITTLLISVYAYSFVFAPKRVLRRGTEPIASAVPVSASR
jgi:hypothetical protein